MPGHPDWGGTALQSGEVVLFNQSNLFFNAGQTRTFTAPVSSPGYIIRLHLWHSAAGGGVMPVQIVLTWVDIAMNAVMAVQEYWVFAGDLNAHHIINGSGPVAGTQLQLAITNKSTLAQNMDADIFMVQNTGYYTSHVWRTDDLAAFTIPGYTTAHSDLNALILGGQAPTSQPGNSTVVQLLPLYEGQIQVAGSSGSGSTDFEIFLFPDADVTIVPNIPATVIQRSDASGHVNFLTYLTRSQYSISLVNQNAAAENISYAVLAALTP